jgi:myo-inositol-1(or 4)-monophosphatase
MEIDLPQLTKGVRLDEMTFVVNVESVVDRLTLHVGDESCNVDHCHAFRTLPSITVDAAKYDPLRDDGAEAVLALFGSICERTREAVASNLDWGESGVRLGQYHVDLEVDALCVDPLLDAGFDVLSEESGLQLANGGHGSKGTVIVDPLDGSTNATLGLPWFATSLCLVVDGTPAVAMVANLATGEWFSAIAGRGATSTTGSIKVGSPVAIDDAILAVSGLPSHHFGWRQFRAMGASALDICAVARGAFDAFADLSFDAHGVWDYAGALLVVQEAGGVIVDALGRDLIVLDHDARRTPVAASGPELLDAVLAQHGRGF